LSQKKLLGFLFVAALFVAVIAYAYPVDGASTVPPQTKIIVSVQSLDKLPVNAAFVTLVYKQGNQTSPVQNFPDTTGKGTTNITIPLNTSVTASFNVTYDQALVLKNFPFTLPVNTTARVNLTVNVVNFTYNILNPEGGLLSSSSIRLQGLPNTSVSAVSLSNSAPSGSFLTPVGNYSVKAFRGPQFYTGNTSIDLSHKQLNITAPFLKLNYQVVSATGKPVTAQTVTLLSSGSIVNTSTQSQGYFSSLLPGAYQLVAYGSGLVNSTVVSLGSNELVRLELPTGYYVSLMLSGSFGSPLSSYMVQLTGPTTVSNETDSGGVAVLGPLPQGLYVVKVFKGSTMLYTTTLIVDSSFQRDIALPNGAGNGQTVSQVYEVARFVLGAAFIVLAALVFIINARRKS
jgi:hypothetical protein